MSNAHPVLGAYYKHIHSLEDYLGIVIEADVDLKVEEGGINLSSVLSGVITASNNAPDNTDKIDSLSQGCSIADVVEEAQRSIFRLPDKNHNILTAGLHKTNYRSSGDSGKGFKRVHHNSNVSFFTSAPWAMLLARIGVAAMLHLLTVPNIFLDVGNNCYTQLTGTPISELPVPKDLRDCSNATAKRDATSANLDENSNREYASRPQKRPRLARNALGTHAPAPATPATSKFSFTPVTKSPRKPNEVLIPRKSVFYGRPTRLSSSKIHLGLPQAHVLSVHSPARSIADAKKSAPPPNLSVQSITRSGWKTEEEMILEKSARHLSKHVFPREYGLMEDSVFTSPGPQNGPRPSFEAREGNIQKLGVCKTPKRIKEALPLFRRMLVLHKRFDYHSMCCRICPSKLKTENAQDLDENSILDIMSESQPVTQAPASTLDVSHESLVVPHGASQAHAAAKLKPRFVDFAYSHSQVHRFVVAAVKAVIPHAFWGAPSNFRLIQTQVLRIIRAHRHEAVSLHEVLKGFVISECDEWLGVRLKRPHVRPRSVSDSIKRRELVEEFVYWFFESFVLSLIKTTFYVTESSAFKNHVLYFRQDDWDVLCRPLIANLSGKTFRKIKLDKDELDRRLRQRQFSHSYVRLLPKDTGVRPIVNLRRKGNNGKSINQILGTAFQILTYEKARQPNLFGAAVSSHSEMHTRLKAFQQRVCGGNLNNMPPLYFVKVDVKACFDTIDQKKLLGILSRIISKERYKITKYSQVIPQNGHFWRSFEAKASSVAEVLPFIQYAKKLARSLRHAIFTDKVIIDDAERQLVLELLEDHITENVVKIGQYFYKQTVGIPQGSILSSILCSFFYGDLEESRLKFHHDPECTMLRWVDDYLFISTQKSKALHFLDTMSKGHPDYGCFISIDKTLTNFWCDRWHPNLISPDAKGFPWCGLLINMLRLDVSADYQRYSAQHIADTLTVATTRHAGRTFAYKMQRMAKQRVDPIFTDSTFNSNLTVHLNIFHNFILTAIKMHHYLKIWDTDIEAHHRFLWGTLKKSILSCWHAIKNRLSTPAACEQGATCRVGQDAVMWMGFYAFKVTLAQKPTAYRSLLRLLNFAMKSSQYVRIRKSLGFILKNHAKELNCIKW